MPSIRKTAVLVTAVFTAIALAACGHQEAPPTGAPTQQQQSVLALMASDATGSLRKTIETTAKSTSVAMTVTGKMAGESVDGSGAIAFGKPNKMELTLNDPKQGQITVRILGTAVYTQVPESQRAAMNGKTWLAMDLADKRLSGGDKTLGALGDQFADMDPAKSVKTLVDSKGLTSVGTETIDGAQTVHYTSTASVDEYLGQVEPMVRPSMKAELTKAGVDEVKVDAWVDEQYRPRRVNLVMGRQGGLSIEYTDYDKPVTIAAPPAGETMDLGQLLGQVKGS